MKGAVSMLSRDVEKNELRKKLKGILISLRAEALDIDDGRVKQPVLSAIASLECAYDETRRSIGEHLGE